MEKPPVNVTQELRRLIPLHVGDFVDIPVERLPPGGTAVGVVSPTAIRLFGRGGVKCKRIGAVLRVWKMKDPDPSAAYAKYARIDHANP